MGVAGINEISLHFSQISYEFENLLHIRPLNYNKVAFQVEAKLRLYKLIGEHQRLIEFVAQFS